jgi:SulP family sulfate permease
MARVKTDLHNQLSRAGLVERIGAGRFFPSVSAATDAFRARQEGS